ncbi:MAG: hypothetical protein A2X35_09190 [Elusimicrobia bacterium GWA2_61_42]|nr:MAG: hypothetical protein A2X35_09190 [Elusimicrobia bacterium GWA2_61_42]
MRLYSANIEDFYDHVRDNTLADTIRDNFKAHLGRYPGIPEYNSFKSSGQYVKNLAEKAALKDVHISFEYEVPYNTSRIDCLLFGRSAAAKAYVFRHPLFAPKYNKLIAEFPVYTMTEVAGLAGKLKECLSSGHGLEVFDRFAQSPIEPSRKLLDNTAKIIAGEKALSLLNEQIVAKNLILAKLEAAKARAEKSVIIVHGGPGTGKSVIAFNLLAELGLKGSQNNVRYACKSKPFREAIHKTVGRESRELFVNLDVFAPAVSKDNAYDVVLVDEVRPGFRARHNYASRPGRKAGGDFSAKIAEAGSRKTAMRFMRDHRMKQKVTRPLSPSYLEWRDNTFKASVDVPFIYN